MLSCRFRGQPSDGDIAEGIPHQNLAKKVLLFPGQIQETVLIVVRLPSQSPVQPPGHGIPTIVSVDKCV